MRKYLLFILPISIILVGIFIYPTLYEIDKLEQKYPVMINRLTGEAKILTSNGWVSTKDFDKANNEMLKYKNEITKLLDVRNDDIAKKVTFSVTKDIKEEVISSISEQLQTIEEEITAYKLYEIDPDNSFTTGDSKETVKKVMGVPDSIDDRSYMNEFSWYYDGSVVDFKNNKVIGWKNYNDNLRIK